MFIPVPFIYYNRPRLSPEELKAKEELRLINQRSENRKFEKKQCEEFCKEIRKYGFTPILNCEYGVRFISNKWYNLWGEYDYKTTNLHWWAGYLNQDYIAPHPMPLSTYWDDFYIGILCKLNIKSNILYWHPNENVSMEFDQRNDEDVRKVVEIVNNGGKTIWYSQETVVGVDKVNIVPVENQLVFDNTMLMLAYGFLGKYN